MFYPPWMGPEQTQTWGLIILLAVVIILAFVGALTGVCRASDPLCVPEVASPSLGVASFAVYNQCPCNVSGVIRNTTNARTLSNDVFGSGNALLDDPRGVSAFSVFFAQFVLHDVYRPINNPAALYTVPVPQPDPVFGTAFTEIDVSVPFLDGGSTCASNPLSNTSYFIDLSNVYGSTVDEMNKVRLFSNGKLRLQSGGAGGGSGGSRLLPAKYSDDGFVMADDRDNDNAGLVSLHTLAVRNHNHWAGEVKRFHWDWSDDQVFWKARQLNIAEWQRITYHEWLPAVFGTAAPPVDVGSLLPDTSLESRVSTEFVSVLMPALIDTMMTNVIYPSIPYSTFAAGDPRDVFNYIRSNNIDAFVEGTAKTCAKAFDDQVIAERRNTVTTNITELLDHVAIHLQRSRVFKVQDWAVAYTCFGPTPIAGDPRDAYEGFLQEPVYPGTSTGLTIATGISNQFLRLRNSDPNYYSFNEQAIGQVYWNTINSASMKTLIQRNSQTEVSQSPFIAQK